MSYEFSTRDHDKIQDFLRTVRDDYEHREAVYDAVGPNAWPDDEWEHIADKQAMWIIEYKEGDAERIGQLIIEYAHPYLMGYLGVKHD